MKIFLGLVFGIFGYALAEVAGALFGFVLGFIVGTLVGLTDRLKGLETQIIDLQRAFAATSPVPTTSTEVQPPRSPIVAATADDGTLSTAAESHDLPVEQEPAADTQPVTAIPAPVDVATDLEADAGVEAARDPADQADPWIRPQPVAATMSRTPPPPGAIDDLLDRIKGYFTGGNLVVKVGVLILFVGVALLVTYAVERNAFPIELRLAGTILGAIVMLVVGWRASSSRRGYGLALQGGAIGILYITVFAAARLYGLLPMGFAFVIMLGIVVLSAVLAVKQDASALITLGSIGGFLAPVLTSTGGGSHVALFSYYALLNLGIVGIAWFKAWRILNLVGFVFTFVIGTAWGIKYYQPAYFSTTEPFLIASFLFYLAVAVLFAHRQPPNLRGYVDGTLVFGLPLVVFGLQSPLVRDMEFGDAYSALGMGIIYLLLARWLWGRGLEHLRMLIEAFLALGVISLSLTIPFAFDGHMTAAAWALEGTGLIWIGVRQQRVLARTFGLLLHIGAGIAFFGLTQYDAYPTTPLFNAAYLGSLFISLGALFSSYYSQREREGLYRWEQPIHWLLLVWGLTWWFGAGLVEIDEFVRPAKQIGAATVFGAASFLLLAVVARRTRWLGGMLAGLAWLPALAFTVIIVFIDSNVGAPFTDLRYLGWPLGLAVVYILLWQMEEVWPDFLIRISHAGALWLTVFLLTWTASWLVDDALPGTSTWEIAVWGVVPSLALLALGTIGTRIAWPIQHLESLYQGRASGPIVIFLLLWVLVACEFSGDPHPISYLPILNPLDLAQLFTLFMIVEWWRRAQAFHIPSLSDMPSATVPALVGGVLFVWLNTATARAVHFITGVRYAQSAMLRSATFQTSISLLWGVTALIVMTWATRRGNRSLWFVGACLLGLLAVKLFTFDLADSGTVARIVSFIGVGLLFVVIGYFSPAPPKTAEEQAEVES